MSRATQTASASAPALVLDVAVPEGTDPALLPSLRRGIEQAVKLVVSSGEITVIQQADELAGLLTGLIQPEVGLVEERLHRLQTIREIFKGEEWLTAEMLNALQPEPSSNRSLPASDWKRRGRIFSVTYGGKEYFPRYEFDAVYQPLPLIRELLTAFGPVADTWKIASWFHYPNGWIVEPGPEGVKPVAPKDALDRRDDLMKALEKRKGSYVA
ncbi:hypothetical protein [Edaphobacter dinghuensis]|uniref:Uncharacterized protein n=1 Tax=Edaphobacter dinghuensis TaxID=1560005 RepID=A0A917HPS7_9BACT|nr:hypothetical protein [Edaphobacter dinghuensis]GGG86825.1 hypothetical protein GCM10011585_33480 [Edaphobacter dinghuensis]